MEGGQPKPKVSPHVFCNMCDRREAVADSKRSSVVLLYAMMDLAFANILDSLMRMLALGSCAESAMPHL